MARKPSSTLTEAELRLMKVVWQRGPSKVQEVVDGLPEKEQVAYSTVLTTLRILEDKGYLKHEKQGRAYVYHPLVGPDEVRLNVLRYMLGSFFDDSPELLVSNLIEGGELEQAELEKIRRMIEEAE